MLGDAYHREIIRIVDLIHDREREKSTKPQRSWREPSRRAVWSTVSAPGIPP